MVQACFGAVSAGDGLAACAGRWGAGEGAMTRRIDVFVAGSQKCGTTTLHAYLRRHPALSAPKLKELHFFDNDRLDWGCPDYGALEAYFSEGDEGRLRYDATPIYGYWPGALSRIRTHNPEARLIFLFRDPFARAWSQWCMEYALGNEHLPFAQAIRQGRTRMPREARDAGAWRIYSYVERGYYGAQEARVLRLFPRRQVLFLKAEDFARDHMATLGRITDFLGLEPFAPCPSMRENARANRHYPTWPSVADHGLIFEELRHDMGLFARLTGLNIEDWHGVIDLPDLRMAAE